MDYEKGYRKFKTIWERLGGSVSESDEGIEIDENQIITSILSDENKTKTIIEEAAQKRESLLISKLRKEAANLGVEGIDEEKDIKKIISATSSHLTKSAGSDKQELSKLNSELQTQLQETKKLLEQKDVEVQTTIDEIKNQSELQKQRLDRNYAAMNKLTSLNLTDAAKANSSRLVDSFISNTLDKYEFKEENGKQVAYKDGKKQFKSDLIGGETSSELVTMDDIVEYEAKTLGFIKSTDAKGGGNLDTPPIPATAHQINDPSPGV
ncbi:hypothetical protein WAF17_21090 [Bernardetia sp. ABR2-2B]|uniref:hypothetical protein n=1 Tax=Bernardetia sp. ABR2-2B TaxID=3127472 RepID=UPI0030CC59E9